LKSKAIELAVHPGKRTGDMAVIVKKLIRVRKPWLGTGTDGYLQMAICMAIGGQIISLGRYERAP
jgi:hypothetical protein